MSDCPQPSWFNDKKHPLWKLATMALGVVALNVTTLTVVLLFRANKFDGDELKNIGVFAGIISGLFGSGVAAYNKLVSKRGGDDTES